MNYRILPYEEWPRLMAYMGAHDQVAPTPETAVAAVAESEGEIVGVWLAQVAWHAEPLLMDSPRVRLDRLFETLSQSFHADTYFYAYTGNEQIARIASFLGLRQIGTAWEGVFKPQPVKD